MPCKLCSRNALASRKVCYAHNNPNRDWAKRRKQSRYYRKVCNDRILTGRCEFCEHRNFMPHELHVDHIDGNHDNNAPQNFQVLCIECHDTKTRLKGENRRH